MSPLRSLRRELPGILPLFGPILISQYAGIANGVIDTVMAARLGTVEVGSVAVGVAIVVPLHLLSLGVLFGMLIIISQLHGKGDAEGIRKIAYQGIWIGLLLGFCAALGCWLLSYRIAWFGVAEELVGLAGEYMRMTAPGLFIMGLGNALRFFCEGQKVIVPVTFISVIMVGINSLLNYCLMFGNGGMPAMGVAGCGLATAISQGCFLTMIACFIRFGASSPGRSLFCRPYAPNREQVAKIFRLGLPIGLGITSEYLVFTLISLFIAATGAVSAAAHQICFSIMMLFFATPMALSLAASVRVGNLMGKGDTEALRASIKGVLLLGALIGFAFSFLMAAGARPIIGIFTTDPAVLGLAVSLLYITACFQLSDALQVCLNGMLRGAGDTTVPFCLTTATYWFLCLPLGYLLSGMPLPWGLGLPPEIFGIRGWWIALTVSITVAAGLLALRVRKTFWMGAVAPELAAMPREATP